MKKKFSGMTWVHAMKEIKTNENGNMKKAKDFSVFEVLSLLKGTSGCLPVPTGLSDGLFSKDG